MVKRYLPLFILSLLLHFFAAWFNQGYFHPDEHFQLLEFGSYKWGNTPEGDLPWEFGRQIRPALQPAVVVAVHRLFGIIGIDDPFFLVFILRLLSAALGFTVAMGLWRYALEWTENQRTQNVLTFVTFLFFAHPFLHARFSSENWSGIFLFGGVYLILFAADASVRRQYIMTALAAGLALGIAFFCRFQIGFSLAGIGLWFLLVRRDLMRLWLPVLLGFALAAAGGYSLDRWFYGEWVLTPWNYFVANIVENAAAGWGVQPWWHYFVEMLVLLVPPFSLVFLALFFVGTYRLRNNILVWAILPFFVAHMMVGHKEIRFLFPMIYGFPLVTVLGLDTVFAKIPSIIKARFVRISIWIMVALNILLLAVLTFKPAQETTAIHKWIYDQGTKSPYVLYAYQKHPYHLVGLMVHYYASEKVPLRLIISADQLSDVLGREKGPLYVFFQGFDLPSELRTLECDWRPAVRSIPLWLRHFNINNWLSRIRIWNVYQCEPAQEGIDPES